MYGVIEYNEEGNPKCEICGEYFKRVLTHVRFKHQMGKREYKKLAGIKNKKGICSKESAEKTVVSNLKNWGKVIKNLMVAGLKVRFKKGDKPRLKSPVSEQDRIRRRNFRKQQNLK